MENVEVTPEVVETPIVEQAVNTENAEPNIAIVETPTEKTFKQSEVDEMVKKRLERDREVTSKKAAQEARDALITEENIEWNGKRITTETEYRQMLQENEVRKKYKDLPEDVVNELVESKKFREQYAESQKETEARTKRESDWQAFLSDFPEADYKTIPQSVWDDVAKGKSLVDAYTKFENMTLREQLAATATAQQIQQQNEQNAQSSTGSLTGNGSATQSVFFTLDQVQKMSQAEVDKNYAAIIQSQKKWYQ